MSADSVNSADPHYTFHSEQIASHYTSKNGKPSGQTRRNVVDIQNNTGTKSVNVYDASGKQIQANSKPLNQEEIQKIRANIFIPGLFNDCQGKPCKKAIQNGSKTRKNRKTRKQRK
jgi:hypothetical protein